MTAIITLEEEGRVVYAVGAGGQTVFDITFSFLLADEVEAYVDGVLDAGATFTGAGVKTGEGTREATLSAPAVSAEVVILRATEIVRSTSFPGVNPMDSDDVDEELDRIYTILQDQDAKSLDLTLDGENFDAGGKRITNLAPGIDDTDAATVGQTAAGGAAAAAASAIEAMQWAVNPEDDDVDSAPGQFSALHWAAKAAASAVAAATWDPGSYRTSALQDVIDAAQDAVVATKYDSADLASQAQAEAGADNTTLMTPLRVAQAIAALGTDLGVINQQIFTASGTWLNATEPGGSFVAIECWGGGGGGGEAQAGGSFAEGGGGGDYSLMLLDRSSLFENVSVTIGAGGAGAAPSTGSGSGAGAKGGDTTFGTLLGATGGAGGDSNVGVGEAESGVWAAAVFYAAPLSLIASGGEAPSAAGGNGTDSIFAGASGAGAENTVANAQFGGEAGYLTDEGGAFDYATGPTVGGTACGGAAGRATQGGAAGGDGLCWVTIFG